MNMQTSPHQGLSSSGQLVNRERHISKPDKGVEATDCQTSIWKIYVQVKDRLCNLQYTYQTGPLHCVTLRQSISVCYHVRDLNIIMINKMINEMIMIRYLKVSGGLGGCCY